MSTKKERVKKIILSRQGYVRTINVELAYRRKHSGHIGRSTVNKAFNELRDAGLVEHGWGGGRNARWKVLKREATR